MEPALIGPPIISATGVMVAAFGYLKRDDPEWQRSMRFVYTVALGQVLLGAVVWLLLATGPR